MHVHVHVYVEENIPTCVHLCKLADYNFCELEREI